MRYVMPYAEIVTHTPGPIGLIERAGRTCYKSTAITGGKFIRMLIERGHESVLEHASATFRIQCDRGVSHELVRHRLASFSQESTRYCSYERGIAVIKPPGLDEAAYAYWDDAMKQCFNAYIGMLQRGITPQIARSVLPNSLATRIVMTANFREWRHVFKLRCSKQAHPQIREVMTMVYDWFLDNYPVVVEDIDVHTDK